MLFNDRFSFVLDARSNTTNIGGGITIPSTTNAPIAKPTNNKEQLINVYNHLAWTNTTPYGISESKAPAIYLKESIVTKSSYIQNLKYAASTLVDSFEVTSQFLQQEQENLEKIKLGGLAENYQQGLNTIKEYTSKYNLRPPESPKHMKPYYNLYGAQETGFNYKLPYLEDYWINVSNNWGGESIVTTTVKSIVESPMKELLPGFAYEGVKQYNFSENTPTIDVGFTLDNTQRQGGLEILTPNIFNSWQRNWEFVFLFTYQNMPNRRTNFLVVPPAIYELNIPGLLYYPFVFVESIEIQSKGVRQSKIVSYKLINEQGEQNKTTKTLIPELFDIKIRFKSLLSQSQNLQFEALNNETNVEYGLLENVLGGIFNG